MSEHKSNFKLSGHKSNLGMLDPAQVRGQYAIALKAIHTEKCANGEMRQVDDKTLPEIVPEKFKPFSTNDIHLKALKLLNGK